MNSVYKWKITVSNEVYYAYLLDDGNEGVNGAPFVLKASTNERSYDGSTWTPLNAVDEQKISQYVSYINVESTYKTKYSNLYTLVSNALGTVGEMLDTTNSGVYFNIDFSSCGDTGQNSGCPILTFKYVSIDSTEKGGAVITNSGVTNGVNWYEVTLYVPKGADGEAGPQGATGAQGSQGTVGAQGSQGDSGDDGVPGSAGKGRNYMLFKTVEKGTPSSDVSGPETGATYDANNGIMLTYPGGKTKEQLTVNDWRDDNECGSSFSGGCDIYMSSGDFSVETETPGVMMPRSWTTPVKINGEDGNNGTDGDFIQFIYFRCANEIELDTPVGELPNIPAKSGGQPIGGSWQDHPSGITDKEKVEYMSTRTRSDSTEAWGAWSTPVIWAKWGEDGIDGDGVEYIFIVTQTKDETVKNDLWQEIEDLFNKYDNDEQQEIWNAHDLFNYLTTHGLPTGNWTDDPSDVSTNEPFEWVSIRRSRWDDTEKKSIYTHFSEPKIWAKWAATPIVFDLSQESVGIGTGDDWKLDIETPIDISTFLTAANAKITEIVNITGTSPDCIVTYDGGPEGYTITVTLDNGFSFFNLAGHRLDINITAKAKAADGEEATGTVTFSISAAQGGKEGKLIKIETSAGSIINDLNNDIFIPASINAWVENGEETLSEGIAWEYQFGDSTASTIYTDNENAITIVLNDYDIGEEATTLYIRAIVNNTIHLHTDIPIIPTPKSSSVLQFDDDSFVIGTGTNDILNVNSSVSMETKYSLRYGNHECDEVMIAKMIVNRGSDSIASFEFDGTGWDIGKTAPCTSATVSSANCFTLMLKINEIESQIDLEIIDGILRVTLYDKLVLDKDFNFTITAAGIYGAVVCNAVSTFKVIGVENGVDGHSFQIKANPDEFSSNQDHSYYFGLGRTFLTVFESSREDTMLTSGKYVYIGYDKNGFEITSNSGNEIDVDASGITEINVKTYNASTNKNGLIYISGKDEKNLERLYVKYVSVDTPLYDSITLYVNEKNGNIPSADFIDDTWLISTGDNSILDVSQPISKTAILEVYYGAVKVNPTAVTRTSSTVSHLDVSNYDSDISAITFTASSGLNLEMPVEIEFDVSGKGTDDVSYNVKATFKIGGLKHGKDGEYYNLRVTPSFIVKNDKGEYVNGYTSIYTVGELTKGSTTQQLAPVAGDLKYTIFFENGTSVTGNTKTKTYFRTYTGYTNAVLIQLEYYVNNEKVDEETVKITSASETNSNLLRGTAFNKGIDFVKQYWTGEHYGETGGTHWPTFEVSDDESLMVSGEKSIVFYLDDGSFALDNKPSIWYYDGFLFRDFTDIKPSTWYTLSFNAFSDIDSDYGNSPLVTYICTYLNAAGGGTAESILSTVFIDGEKTYCGENGRYCWNGSIGSSTDRFPVTLEKTLTGERHSFTFKTLSTIPEDHITIIFRTGYKGKVAVSRIKLEEGKNATPFILNTNDTGGKDGKDGKTPVLYVMDTSGITDIKVNVAQSVIPQNLFLKLYKVVGDSKTIVTPVQNAVTFNAYNSSGGTISNSGIIGPEIVSETETVALRLSGMTRDVERIEITWRDSQGGTVLGMVAFSVIRESLGKVLYSAGVWSAQPYSSTTTSAPFVCYTAETPSKFYYLAADIASVSDVPGNSDKWVEMTKYQAILTDTIIAQMATLGKAVFFDDFMYSQEGVANVAGSTYSDFLQDVNGNLLTDKTVANILSNSKFVPNYFVNFVTGESYGGLHYGATRDVASIKTTDSLTINDYDDVYIISGTTKPATINLTSKNSDIGREIKLINSSADKNSPISNQLIKISCNGHDIFENGEAFEYIYVSNESVELIGLGSTVTKNFKGWAVTNRRDILTNSRYGMNFSFLAHLYVKYNSTDKRISFVNYYGNVSQTFDGSKTVDSITESEPFFKVIFIADINGNSPAEGQNVSITSDGKHLYFRFYIPPHWFSSGADKMDLSAIIIPHSNDDIWINNIEENGNWLEIGADANDLGGKTIEFLIYNGNQMYSQNKAKANLYNDCVEGYAFDANNQRLSDNNFPSGGGYKMFGIRGLSSYTVSGYTGDGNVHFKSVESVPYSSNYGIPDNRYTCYKFSINESSSPYKTGDIFGVLYATKLGLNAKIGSTRFTVAGDPGTATLDINGNVSTALSSDPAVSQTTRGEWDIYDSSYYKIVYFAVPKSFSGTCYVLVSTNLNLSDLSKSDDQYGRTIYSYVIPSDNTYIGVKMKPYTGDIGISTTITFSYNDSTKLQIIIHQNEHY